MPTDRATAGRRVGITGLGIVSALGHDVAAFTDALRRGQNGIHRLHDSATAGCDVKIGAVVGDFSLASVLERTAVPPSLAAAALRCAGRLPLGMQTSLAAALEAWGQAGLPERPADPARIGIVVGGSNLSPRLAYELHEKFRATPTLLTPRYAYLYLDSVHLGVISEVLRIHGEGCTVGGASASGNVAIIKARQAIRAGDLDLCLVIGAMADLSPMELQAFFNIGAMVGKDSDDEPERACRPFDAGHQGFVFGQAAGGLMLEALDSAERRGARVLAEIPGAASLLDGNHLPNPSVDGEAMAMAEALRQAGLSPQRVDYLNAHGTGSPLGDRTEVAAIRRVFGAHVPRLWINSTKSLVGHCLYSAGTVEAIATVVQMRGSFVHPNRNLETPIDDCRFAGPRAEPQSIAVALSNSFGFGGINTSIAFLRGDEE